MPEYPYPEPVVQITDEQELARDLVVIPNHSVQLVPNIGVVGGTHSVLVIETGLGPRNAEKVVRFATDYAEGRKLYLTTTHFHPEHAFGAQAFAGQATFLINKAQADDLATKGSGYLYMFRGLGEPVARQLEGVELTTPDIIYDETYDLDLGGRVVRMRATGRGHSKGDQVITSPTPGSCSPATWWRQASSRSSRGSRRTTPTCPAPGGSRSWSGSRPRTRES
jgi:glyoxylase-like metal-dependent hydrolase (beta-lactamase superfamily II)